MPKVQKFGQEGEKNILLDFVDLSVLNAAVFDKLNKQSLIPNKLNSSLTKFILNSQWNFSDSFNNNWDRWQMEFIIHNECIDNDATRFVSC